MRWRLTEEAAAQRGDPSPLDQPLTGAQDEAHRVEVVQQVPEQTMLVATETKRLAELSEHDLEALLTRVRRARTKYLKLYRRRSADLVVDSSSRAGTPSSNERTLRKAEILEDALARVARALASEARRTARQLKNERLAAAAAAKGSPVRSEVRPNDTDRGPGSSGHVEPVRGRAASKSRQASRMASGARKQARRDRR